MRAADTGSGTGAGAVRGLGPRIVRPSRRLTPACTRGRRPGTGTRVVAATHTLAEARLRQLGHARHTGDVRRARQSGEVGQVGRLGQHPLRRVLENSGDPVHDRPHGTSRVSDHGLDGVGHRLDRNITHRPTPEPYGLATLTHALPHGLGRTFTRGLYRPCRTRRLHTLRSRYPLHRVRALAAEEPEREQARQQQHHLQRAPPGHGAQHAHSGIGQSDGCGSQDEGVPLLGRTRARRSSHGPPVLAQAPCY
ncbi:hypothetical protein [Streptomyces longisporoflavus]|uniref:hypothetical protein n=1 Tax=Streptomyces longisporoflavus TaxID=28044 RepID=UPI00167EE3DE|nr:hypothetical protein [Streptomyces longisporoflavus]